MVGAESDGEVEEVDEGYEPSVADTADLEVAQDGLEEFFPGELAPCPPAAVTPDGDEDSDAHVEAPEEVDGRLQLPEPKDIDRGEAAVREEARSLRHMMTLMTHAPQEPILRNMQMCQDLQAN